MPCRHLMLKERPSPSLPPFCAGRRMTRCRMARGAPGPLRCTSAAARSACQRSGTHGRLERMQIRGDRGRRGRSVTVHSAVPLACRPVMAAWLPDSQHMPARPPTRLPICACAPTCKHVGVPRRGDAGQVGGDGGEVQEERAGVVAEALDEGDCLAGQHIRGVILLLVAIFALVALRAPGWWAARSSWRDRNRPGFAPLARLDRGAGRAGALRTSVFEGGAPSRRISAAPATPPSSTSNRFTTTRGREGGQRRQQRQRQRERQRLQRRLTLSITLQL